MDTWSSQKKVRMRSKEKDEKHKLPRRDSISLSQSTHCKYLDLDKFISEGIQFSFIFCFPLVDGHSPKSVRDGEVIY